MHRQVEPRRHLAFFHLLADFFLLLRAPLVAELVPLREVQVLSAFDHVPVHEEGHRCQPPVPGPNRLVGVAVPAGAVHHRLHVVRRLHLAGDGRVFVGKDDQLHQHECNADTDTDLRGALHPAGSLLLDRSRSLGNRWLRRRVTWRFRIAPTGLTLWDRDGGRTRTGRAGSGPPGRGDAGPACLARALRCRAASRQRRHGSRVRGDGSRAGHSRRPQDADRDSNRQPVCSSSASFGRSRT